MLELGSESIGCGIAYPVTRLPFHVVRVFLIVSELSEREALAFAHACTNTSAGKTVGAVLSH